MNVHVHVDVNRPNVHVHVDVDVDVDARFDIYISPVLARLWAFSRSVSTLSSPSKMRVVTDSPSDASTVTTVTTTFLKSSSKCRCRCRCTSTCTSGGIYRKSSGDGGAGSDSGDKPSCKILHTGREPSTGVKT